MSSTKTTLILAVAIMAAAFAGIVIADEADAEGDATVTVSAGGATLPYTAVGGSITMPTADSVAAFYTVPEGYTLSAWRDVATGALYTPGTAYTITSDMTVEPYLTPSGAIFVVDGAEWSAAISMGKISVPADAAAAVEKKADGKSYTFAGWQHDGQILTAEQVVALSDVEPGDIFTAVFDTVHSVSWTVDGVTIATGTSNAPGMPESEPAKEHYAFVEWRDGSGTAWSEDYTYTQDTIWTAVFEADLIEVVFKAGDAVVGTVEVRYGSTVNALALPSGYSGWDFDFATPITEAIVIEAVAAEPEPETPDTGVYTVRFIVSGAVIATYQSNAITLPTDPVIDGQVFQGWAIGTALIADPVSYAYTQDTDLVALFQAATVVTHTVSLDYIEGADAELVVIDGQAAELPALGEGRVWALGDRIYEGGPVTADVSLKEVDEFSTVSFAVNGVVYGAYDVEVRYGETVSAPSQFVFPSGFEGWDFDFATPITEDKTIEAAPIPEPEKAPAFYQTTAGQAVLVIVGFVLVAFIACIVMDYGGLRTKLLSLRKGKGGEE